MLLIEVKGKEYVENGNFNLGTSFDKLTDENEKNKRIELAKSKLKGTEITSVSDLNSNFGITQEQFQQEAYQSMQKAQQDAMAPIYQKLDEAIQAVGKAEGVVYIFDLARTPIPFVGAQSVDVTAKVKTQLGIK